LKDGERVLTGTNFMCEITYHNLAIAKEIVMQLVPVLIFVITDYAHMLWRMSEVAYLASGKG